MIVNNDRQAYDKRGRVSFQDEEFRMRIVSSIRPVDHVYLCTDADGSVCQSIRDVVGRIRDQESDAKILFAK